MALLVMKRSTCTKLHLYSYGFYEEAQTEQMYWWEKQGLLQSTLEHSRALQSALECFRVLQSASEEYWPLQSPPEPELRVGLQ